MNLNDKNRDVWSNRLEIVVFVFLFLIAFPVVFAGKSSWLPFLPPILVTIAGTLGAGIILFISKLLADLIIRLIVWFTNVFINKNKITAPPSLKLTKITSFLYSEETQKDIFEPTGKDWNKELFSALELKDFSKARWINVRYSFRFLQVMLLLSPIGDLVEFIKKIAK